MTAGCLMVGTAALHLASAAFTLSWTHSVERVEWRERWRLVGSLLELETSSVRGSGAGMEPGADAVLEDGWWIAPGHLRIDALVLAASGETQGGWTLCSAGDCREIGARESAPVRLAPCPASAGPSGTEVD
jgi:hypothetical protein